MSKHSVLRKLLAWLFLLLTITSATAWAQPTPEEEAQGKQLAREAFEAYQQSNFLTALENFEKARKLYPTGQVLRMTAYTLLALERWVEAADALQAALAAEYKPLDDDVKAEVQQHLDKALTHIATAVISSEIEGATVSIDSGEPIPLPTEVRLLKGTHSFVASAEGHNDDERTVDLPGGERFELELRPVRIDAPAPKPKPAPLPPPQPEAEEPSAGWFPYQKEIGFAVGGVGVALTGVGIATLVAGTSLRSATQENVDAHNAAYGEDCSRADFTLCVYDIELINRDGERADSLQTAGVGMTIAGLVLAATGVTFLVFAPWGDEQPADDRSPSPTPPNETARRRAPTTVACGPYGAPGLGCFGTF